MNLKIALAFVATLLIFWGAFYGEYVTTTVSQTSPIHSLPTQQVFTKANSTYFVQSTYNVSSSKTILFSTASSISTGYTSSSYSSSNSSTHSAYSRVPCNPSCYSGVIAASAESEAVLGVQTTVNVANLSSYSYRGTIEVFTSIRMSNSSLSAQIGYLSQKGSPDIGFLEVWNYSNELVDGNTFAVSPGSHTFSIYKLIGNTTWWAFAYDGYVENTYGLNSNFGISSGTFVFEYSNSLSFSTPNIKFSDAISVLTTGPLGWIKTSYGNFAWSPDLPAFGIEGSNQNAALVPDQVIIGSSIPLPLSAPLWALWN